MTAPIASAHKFTQSNTGAGTVLYLLEQRIKAARGLPAPSTGDSAVDDATRREFERLRNQPAAEQRSTADCASATSQGDTADQGSASVFL